MQIKINGTLHECERMITHIHDFEWDMRDNVELFMQMTHAEADELFVSGIAWSYLFDDGTEVEQSEYSVAGRITDYRNGTVSVRMGKRTEAERLTAELEEAQAALFDAEQALAILGVE